MPKRKQKASDTLRHSICERCWYRVTAVIYSKQDMKLQKCCVCGKQHQDGGYFRELPLTCGGKHDVAESQDTRK